MPGGSSALGQFSSCLRSPRWKEDNVHLYQELAVRSMTTMREVEALTELEPDRKGIDGPDARALFELKKTYA